MKTTRRIKLWLKRRWEDRQRQLVRDLEQWAEHLEFRLDELERDIADLEREYERRELDHELERVGA